MMNTRMEAGRLLIVPLCTAVALSGVGLLTGCPVIPPCPAPVLEGTWDGTTAGGTDVELTFDECGLLTQIRAVAAGGETGTITLNNSTTDLNGSNVVVEIPLGDTTVTYDAQLTNSNTRLSGSVSESFQVGDDATVTIPSGNLTVDLDGGGTDPNDGGGTDPNDGKGNSGLTGKFAGSETCSLCHSSYHQDWSGTLHARALETLEGIGQANNEQCLPCHVVGFGEEGGFVDRATTNALAGVGCESCHGPGMDHVRNVSDETLRPKVDISAEVCGECHTGEHHPNYEEWASSAGHATVPEHVAENFFEGSSLNSCGQCHSGDFYYLAILNSEPVNDDYLEGVPPAEQHAVECAICHDPHAQTGNAAEPEDGRDFQLRYPEVASPLPTNTIDAATNAARFNICGQCHHSRGRTWTDTGRGPHHSVQSNMYVGEMPVPEGTDPLVLSRTSVHSFATEQCATCHMYRQDFMSDVAPAIAGHTFEVNNNSCSSVGCHPSEDAAIAAQNTLQTEVQSRLDDIAARLGDPSTWEYSAEGGPEDQDALSDGIKQIRFLYHYVVSDGSLGIHNPDYIRSILDTAEDLLADEGL